MSLRICVLLWAHDGCEADLIEYEDQVLPLIADHGGRVLQRARTAGTPGEPLEIHLIEFPTEDALTDYLGDERRVARTALRDRAIARTQLLRVDLV